jgi:hypothetical protein
MSMLALAVSWVVWVTTEKLLRWSSPNPWNKFDTPIPQPDKIAALNSRDFVLRQ